MFAAGRAPGSARPSGSRLAEELPSAASSVISLEGASRRQARLHWILLAKPGGGDAARALALSVAVGAAARIEWLWYAEPSRILAGGLIWCAIHAIELLTSEFAVTTTRLIFKVGSWRGTRRSCSSARWSRSASSEAPRAPPELRGPGGDRHRGAREVFPACTIRSGSGTTSSRPRSGPSSRSAASGTDLRLPTPRHASRRDRRRPTMLNEELESRRSRAWRTSLRSANASTGTTSVVTGCDDGRWLAIFVRDDAGAIMAGLHGWTWGAHGLRANPVGPGGPPGAGLGARLLEEAEREAAPARLPGDAARHPQLTRRPASTGAGLPADRRAAGLALRTPRALLPEGDLIARPRQRPGGPG